MAPTDTIISAIGGDKAQRETAYEQITALAHGDNEDVTTTFSAATVHVSGLEDGGADEAAALTKAFAQFGSVLAVTLDPAAAYALLTFSEVSEAQKAVDGAASLGTSGLAVRTVDTRAALGSTDDMGGVMRQHQQHVEKKKESRPVSNRGEVLREQVRSVCCLQVEPMLHFVWKERRQEARPAVQPIFLGAKLAGSGKRAAARRSLRVKRRRQSNMDP